MTTLLERLAELAKTFDEDRPALMPTPPDCWARNKHGDALDFDAEETVLLINALPALLRVVEAARLAVDGGYVSQDDSGRITGYVDSDDFMALERALRALEDPRG